MDENTLWVWEEPSCQAITELLLNFTYHMRSSSKLNDLKDAKDILNKGLEHVKMICNETGKDTIKNDDERKEAYHM